MAICGMETGLLTRVTCGFTISLLRMFDMVFRRGVPTAAGALREFLPIYCRLELQVLHCLHAAGSGVEIFLATTTDLAERASVWYNRTCARVITSHRFEQATTVPYARRVTILPRGRV